MARRTRLLVEGDLLTPCNFALPDDIEDYSCKSDVQLPQQVLNREPLMKLLERRQLSGATTESFDIRVTNCFLPNAFTDTPVNFNSRVYNGQFSPDRDLYCSSQNEVKVYDSSDVFNWRLQHEITVLNLGSRSCGDSR
jgi:hypothetical protein